MRTKKNRLKYIKNWFTKNKKIIIYISILYALVVIFTIFIDWRLDRLFNK